MKQFECKTTLFTKAKKNEESSRLDASDSAKKIKTRVRDKHVRPSFDAWFEHTYKPQVDRLQKKLENKQTKTCSIL